MRAASFLTLQKRVTPIASSLAAAESEALERGALLPASHLLFPAPSFAPGLRGAHPLIRCLSRGFRRLDMHATHLRLHFLQLYFQDAGAGKVKIGYFLRQFRNVAAYGIDRRSGKMSVGRVLKCLR